MYEIRKYQTGFYTEHVLNLYYYITTLLTTTTRQLPHTHTHSTSLSLTISYSNVSTTTAVQLTKNTKNLSMEWIRVGVGIRFNSLLLHFYLYVFFPFAVRTGPYITLCMWCEARFTICTLLTSVTWNSFCFANFGYLNGFHVYYLYIPWYFNTV